MLRRSNLEPSSYSAISGVKLKRILSLGLLAIFIGIRAASAESNSTDAPKESSYVTSTFQGREYGIFTPTSATAPTPAVFVLHGGGGNADIIRRYSGFDVQAQRYGILSVYPNGTDGFWNDGRESQDVIKSTADDVGYLSGLIDHLVRQKIIDPARVYFIGISNGGGMALRMACEAPERVAGIAVIATKQLQNLNCSRVNPTPAAFFFGTDDKVSPHEGRVNGDEGLWGNKGKTYSAEKTLALWRSYNHCTGEATSITLDADPKDDTVVHRRAYNDCMAPLAYFEIVGGGHSWPDTPSANRNPAINYVLGTVSHEINANEEALKLWLGR